MKGDHPRDSVPLFDGEMDEYPEAAFFNVGTIDEAVEKAKKLMAQ